MVFFEAMATFYHVKSCIKMSIVNVQNAFCGDPRLMSPGTHTCKQYFIYVVQAIHWFVNHKVKRNIFEIHSLQIGVGLLTLLVESVRIC